MFSLQLSTFDDVPKAGEVGEREQSAILFESISDLNHLLIAA